MRSPNAVVYLKETSFHETLFPKLPDVVVIFAKFRIQNCCPCSKVLKVGASVDRVRVGASGGVVFHKKKIFYLKNLAKIQTDKGRNNTFSKKDLLYKNMCFYIHFPLGKFSIIMR